MSNGRRTRASLNGATLWLKFRNANDSGNHFRTWKLLSFFSASTRSSRMSLIKCISPVRKPVRRTLGSVTSRLRDEQRDTDAQAAGDRPERSRRA